MRALLTEHGAVSMDPDSSGSIVRVATRLPSCETAERSMHRLRGAGVRDAGIVEELAPDASIVVAGSGMCVCVCTAGLAFGCICTSAHQLDGQDVSGGE